MMPSLLFFAGHVGAAAPLNDLSSQGERWDGDYETSVIARGKTAALFVLAPEN